MTVSQSGFHRSHLAHRPGKFKESPEVAFQGKRVCVNGPIQDYRDKPEIIVTSPSQLRVDAAETPGQSR